MAPRSLSWFATAVVVGCGHAVDVADAGGACHPTCGSGLADWPMPNARVAGLPNWQSYDVSSVPGVVNDKVTGLDWQQSIDSGVYTWPAADAYCSHLSLGGHADWRLPSVIELVSITNVANLAPAIDSTAFPNTLPDYFWTATPVFPAVDVWWAVNFNTGYANDNGAAAGTPRVRCVAGGVDVGAIDAQAARYAASAGTVFAAWTKLTWQAAVAPTTYDWSSAASSCANLNLDGVGWRLPTVNELVSLTDYSRSNPALDTTYFAGTPTDSPYWASSPVAGDPSRAWYVSAYSGNMFYSDITSMYYARCVR